MIVGLLAVAGLAGCPAAPRLSVLPLAVNFGTTATTDVVTISNTGGGTLTWSVTGAPAWLEVGTSDGRVGGTLTGGRKDTLQLRALRGAVDETGVYTAELRVTSDGGAQTVAVRMEKTGPAAPPQLSYSPLSIDLGEGPAAVLTITNTGGGTLTWAISEDLPWLNLSALSGEATSGNPSRVTFLADRQGLDPGAYTGQVALSTNDADATIDVRMDVLEAMPIIAVSSEPLEFDAALPGETREITIGNIGTGTLTWDVTTSVTTAGNWLSVAPVSGATTTTPNTVTVSVTPGNLTPADFPAQQTDLIGTISIDSNTSEGDDPVVLEARLTTRPTTLEISPSDVDFRTFLVNKLLSITNSGVGTLYWWIELAEPLPWLTITADPAPLPAGPVPPTPPYPAGLAAGTPYGVAESGAETRAVVLTVNRSGLAPGTTLTGTMTVRAVDGLGNTLAPQTVTVRVKAPDDPELAVIVRFDPPRYVTVGGEQVEIYSETNETPAKPLLNIPASGTGIAYISNAGTTGTVNWSVDRTGLPEWITQIFPLQGTKQAGQPPDELNVVVDRSILASGGYLHDLPILSNAGNTMLRITLNVPKRRSIGADPGTLNFGQEQTVGSFLVANFGDAGTELDFRVVADQGWLFFSPQTGTSIGTATPPPFKDWRTIGVAVDRFALNGESGTAIFEVYALAYDQLGREIRDPEIAARQVILTVQPNPLSILAPNARLRIPSVVRWPLLMRDYKDRVIQDGPDHITEDAFTIWENNVPIETFETSKFVTSGLNLKYNVFVLMDYSGSAFAAAGDADPSILTAADPLQQLYGGPLSIPGFDPESLAVDPAHQDFGVGALSNGVVGYFFHQLPENYQVGLLEFHDRSRPTFMIQNLTDTHSTLRAALSGIGISDHGASELFPAIVEAIFEHLRADAGLLPYDDSDIRALVVISDGRMTTPSGDPAATIQDVIDLARLARVQIFPIGWGADVNHEPLARLATETGGYYYPVDTEAGAPVPGGPAVRRPSVQKLAEAIRRLKQDMQSFLVLSYITLNQESNVDARVTAVFNPELTYPRTPAPPAEEDQGTVSGAFTQSLNYASVAGDVRMGQISMRSSGVQRVDPTDPGSTAARATVVVRAEYVPRNVDKFEFVVTSTTPGAAPFLEVVDAANGGVLTYIDDGTGLPTTWDIEYPNPMDTTRFILRANPPRLLPYGAFGDLFKLEFEGILITSEFTVSLDINNGLYAGDTEPKYFMAPDTLRVGPDRTVAPAFPTPEVTPTVIDFGSNAANDPNADIATLVIRNMGGYYPRPPSDPVIYLTWAADPPSSLVVSPRTGSLVRNTDEVTVQVVLDRSIASGSVNTVLPITYGTGALGIEGVTEVTVRARVLAPALGFSSTNITIPAADNRAFLTILNTGQSTLEWTVGTNATAAWLSVAPDSGSATHYVPSTVTLDVDRTGLPPASTQTTTFWVRSNVGNELITVNVEVP